MDEQQYKDLLTRVEALERSQEVKLWRIAQAEQMEGRVQGRLDRAEQMEGRIQSRLDRLESELKAELNTRATAQDHAMDLEREARGKLQSALYLFALGLLAFSGSVLYIVSQHH